MPRDLDIEALAKNADVSIYERGWTKHAAGEIEVAQVMREAAL